LPLYSEFDFSFG